MDRDFPCLKTDANADVPLNLCSFEKPAGGDFVRKWPYLIYYLQKSEFMGSVASFKSSSTQHDVQFLNCRPNWRQHMFANK